ncbi:MAG: AEC family transporter [bacterium]|nr:AEC family transporter [bacterium]
MAKIISQMIVLFLMILVGYITGKAKIFTEESNKVMSRVVIYVANPALILNTVTSGQIVGTKLHTLYVIGVGTAYFILVPLLVKLLVMAIPVFHAEKKIYQAMFVFTNLGFMGIPVINSIYGPGAVFYIGIFIIPFNLLVYTYGVLLISGDTESKIDFKKVINPVSVASLLTLAIYFLGIKTHTVINETVSLLGSITTPLAMVTIGSNLALVPLKDVFLDWKMYFFAVIKMLALPIIIFFLFSFVIKDAMLLGVLVVMTAMPTASNVTLLCNEYEADGTLVAKGTFIGTVLSLLTIPILAFFIL